MAKEIELKLALDEGRLRALAAAPVVRALASGEPVSKHLKSTYFDTPECALAARRACLRVRSVGGRRVQTVKTSSSNGPAYLRGEWETEVRSDAPDLAAFAGAPVAELLNRPEIRDRLRELFVTEFTRTTRTLHLPGGSEVELAVDVGEIRANGKRVPIHEAELELKAGTAADLFALARRLHDVQPFRMPTLSKADRGYALVAPAPPPARKAASLHLEPGLTVEQAFRRIAGRCVTHMRANEECAFDGADIEGVHQMRVASRRLRSAIALFRKALPPEWTEGLAARVKWLTQGLGPARDWDVFLAETLDPLQMQIDDDALAVLRSRARSARDEAYGAVRAMIEDPRYTRLLLDLGRWLESDGWHVPGAEGERLARRIGGASRKILARRYKRVRKAGKRLLELSPEELHKLRIRIKGVRYATDFLGSLYDAKRVKRFTKALKTLQDLLGHVQDVAVTRPLLRSLVEPDDPDALALERAIGAVAGWQAAARAKTFARLEGAWSDFRSAGRFWKT